MSFDKIVLEHSTRGMDILYEKHPHSYIENASKALLKLKRGTVFLYTGFYVGGFAETDGPIGTYFLSKALMQLGFKPLILTDAYCKDYFKECETIYLSNDQCNDSDYCKELIEKYNPVCQISIERCGKNAAGIYANSRAKDISPFTVALDNVYTMAAKTSLSIAVGDGGNEIGMGNFQKSIKTHLKLSPCVVKCDYPIIASVSNWGAYGIIACLEKYFKEALLPTFKDVDEYLHHILDLGSVDGIHMKNVKSVDGKAWILEESILSQLKEATKNIT